MLFMILCHVMDCMKEDMQRFGVTEEDSRDRVRWTSRKKK